MDQVPALPLSATRGSVFPSVRWGEQSCLFYGDEAAWRPLDHHWDQPWRVTPGHGAPVSSLGYRKCQGHPCRAPGTFLAEGELLGLSPALDASLPSLPTLAHRCTLGAAWPSSEVSSTSLGAMITPSNSPTWWRPTTQRLGHGAWWAGSQSPPSGMAASASSASSCPRHPWVGAALS